MTEATIVHEVDTPVGTARLHADGPDAAPACLVLGHGAGGGVDARDLLAARDAGLRAGLRVVRVEQPWRVEGRRVAEAPVRLDQAWSAVLGRLEGPLVVGGRSAGARVACRTAEASRAAGVLALAFPLAPPAHPERTRLPELLLPQVPVLVVQGSRDPFGVPEPAAGRQVHVVHGADHAFAVRRSDGRTAVEVDAEVTEVVARWLAQLRR